MKKFLFALCLVGVLLCPGCSVLGLNDDADGATVDLFELAQHPLTFSGPDGALKLEASYFPSPSDVPGCAGVISHTTGRDVYTALWLSFYFYDDTPVGGELRLERFNFGAAASSNSNEYTNTFTGKMVLKERSANRVVISMENVRLKIAHGEYKLNGYLVARTKALALEY